MHAANVPPPTPAHASYEQPSTSDNRSQSNLGKNTESPGPSEWQKPRQPVMPVPPNIDTLYVSEKASDLRPSSSSSPPAVGKDVPRGEGDGDSGKKVDDSGRSSRLSGDEAPLRFQAKKASASHKEDIAVIEDL